jgi:hypothetical protein
MTECKRCGFWESDYEACTCPHFDKWYACPIESKKPQNQKALEEYAEWANKYQEQFVMKSEVDNGNDD